MKQRRCGPFWFSSGCPKTGVTEEAHLHCRQCGRVSHPSQGRQSEPKPGKAKVHRRETAFHGSGVSTGWFHELLSRLCLTACPRGRAAREPEPACARRNARMERPMATQRILDFLATRRPNGPCLVVDLDVVRDNFRAFEKALPEFQNLLRGESKPGAGDPAPARLDGLVLRHRVRCRSRDGAGRRRDRRPHLLRQHHQEGARHRPRLFSSASASSPSTASRRSRRSPAPLPAPACSAAC